jgi:hypothetical protein
MRWCQVVNEADLPPIYATLANVKKAKVRATLETELAKVLLEAGYLESFPLSPTQATKIVELNWSSMIPDNFAVGINLFNMGSTDEDAMEHQRLLNYQSDTITSSDAAPSLIDVATIQDPKNDVTIPRTLAKLRYCVERAYAMWAVLLGPHHPAATQHKRFRERLILHEKRLTEQSVTRDPKMQFLVPALLARWVQIQTNQWLVEQRNSPGIEPFPNLVQVFTLIATHTQWEPIFPQAYLKIEQIATNVGGETLAGGSHHTVVTDASSLTGASNTSRTQSSGTNVTPRAAATQNATPNNMIRNAHYNAIFTAERQKGIRMKELRKALQTRGNVQLPKNAAGDTACLSFHIVGQCNERCGLAADHKEHTEEEDQAIKAWLEEHYHL